MKVILHNEANPENNAMLQALYSRSSKSVTEHLARLQETGSGGFMERYYIGFGHASVGDLGFVTLYFEGISMLAAKAIEDNPLFNGQECSSRYIDFSNQPFVNPFRPGSVEHAEAQMCLDNLRAFYVRSLDPLLDELEERFPRDEGVSETVYYKALRAKAFDILRGFLPAGATTNVAWTTSLRKAHEQLVMLMHHPLYEVRELACRAYLQLWEAYPHSFKAEYAKVSVFDLENDLKKIEGEEVFKYRSSINHFYATQPCDLDKAWLKVEQIQPPIITLKSEEVIDSQREAHNLRPRKESLMRHSPSSQAILRIGLTLDFGSFRDLQRHRGGYCSNPILGGEIGFHPWYYENLCATAKVQASSLLDSVASAASSILKDVEPRDNDSFIDRKLRLQYIIPMGALVPVSLVYSVSQAVYVSELRSGKTVHPTLRPVAQDLARFLHSIGVPTDADMEESEWTVRRGSQDIIEK